MRSQDGNSTPKCRRNEKSRWQHPFFLPGRYTSQARRPSHRQPHRGGNSLQLSCRGRRESFRSRLPRSFFLVRPTTRNPGTPTNPHNPTNPRTPTPHIPYSPHNPHAQPPPLVLLKQRSIRSISVEASQCEKTQGASMLFLATNLSSTVFAASSEFQTQRSPKRDFEEGVVWNELFE